MSNPRYRNATELLQLAIALQGATVGYTIDEIQARFDITRKTAERRLNALRELFPSSLEYQTFDGRKRHWRLRDGHVPGLIRLDPEELATLDSTLALIEREGRPDQAQVLRALSDKVRALSDPKGLPKVETDAEVLLEGEGLAMRPGPRPKIPLDTVGTLRECLLAGREARLAYRSRIKQETTSRVVHPYGFLFGGRHYLIARDPEAGDVRMFSLANIQAVSMLESRFERPDDFDLRQYARLSFGVFQDEPLDVVWRFSPEVAGNASEYQFHPTQRLEREADGSLIVRFRASGLWEMAWHAFQWRRDIEILEPAVLRETLVDMLEDALAVHERD